jgi:hypothetical protein
VKYGDYVLTEAGWMKIQESASRPGTIEFHADRPGQFQNAHSHLHILGTKSGNGAASINVYSNPVGYGMLRWPAWTGGTTMISTDITEKPGKNRLRPRT